MRTAIISMVAVLAGCSTVGQEELVKQPPVLYSPVIIDSDCAFVAKYARAIALYRNLGIGIDEVDYAIRQPKGFPIEPIKRLVYNANQDISIQEDITIYNNCVEETYYAFSARLGREDLVYQYNRKQEIAQRLAESRAQQLRQAAQKTTLIKKTRKTNKK